MFQPLILREEEPTDEPSGHVTSISVLRPYRRLGLANRLMKQAREFSVQQGCLTRLMYQRKPWSPTTTRRILLYMCANRIELLSRYIETAWDLR